MRRQTDEGIERLSAEKAALARDVRQNYAEVGHLAGTTVAGDPRVAGIQPRIREAERRVTTIDEELAALR